MLPFVGVSLASALLDIVAFSAVKKSVNPGILGYPKTKTSCKTFPSSHHISLFLLLFNLIKAKSILSLSYIKILDSLSSLAETPLIDKYSTSLKQCLAVTIPPNNQNPVPTE